MMNSAKVEHVFFERPIEIYENERMWIGRGFSKLGLLPGERGPYSTKDGSLSWKSMREASLALLRGDVSRGTGNGNGRGGVNISSSIPKRIRRGWSFHEEDSVGINNEYSDKENLRQEDQYECTTKDGETSLEENYCGFVPIVGPGDGPTDQDGWQYFVDFAPQSLLSPHWKRYVHASIFPPSLHQYANMNMPFFAI